MALSFKGGQRGKEVHKVFRGKPATYTRRAHDETHEMMRKDSPVKKKFFGGRKKV